MTQILDNLILCGISEMYNCFDLIKESSLHINAAEELVSFPKFPKINYIVQIHLNWCDAVLQNINENGILFNVIKLIDFYIYNGKRVVINCYAGASRSVTIVLAYLMYKNKYTVQEALSFVRQKRPIINPNYGFVCQLYKLQDTLHNLDNLDYSSIINKNTEHLAKEINETYNKVTFIKEILTRENYLRELV